MQKRYSQVTVDFRLQKNKNVVDDIDKCLGRNPSMHLHNISKRIAVVELVSVIHNRIGTKTFLVRKVARNLPGFKNMIC